MNSTEDGYNVDPKELWKYQKYLYELHTFVNQVGSTACREGLNPDGFAEGLLLRPLAAGCNELADHVVRPAFSKVMEKVDAMAEATSKAAENYGLTDEMIAQGWEEMYNG